MQFASYIRKNLVQNLHSISGEEDMRGRSHSVGTSMKRFVHPHPASRCQSRVQAPCSPLFLCVWSGCHSCSVICFSSSSLVTCLCHVHYTMCRWPVVLTCCLSSFHAHVLCPPFFCSLASCPRDPLALLLVCLPATSRSAALIVMSCHVMCTRPPKVAGLRPRAPDSDSSCAPAPRAPSSISRPHAESGAALCFL